MILTYTPTEVLTLSKQNSYFAVGAFTKIHNPVSFIIQFLLSSHVALCLFIYNSWLHVDYIVASQIKYAHEWNECQNQGYTAFFFIIISFWNVPALFEHLLNIFVEFLALSLFSELTPCATCAGSLEQVNESPI